LPFNDINSAIAEHWATSTDNFWPIFFRRVRVVGKLRLGPQSDLASPSTVTLRRFSNLPTFAARSYFMLSIRHITGLAACGLVAGMILSRGIAFPTHAGEPTLAPSQSASTAAPSSIEATESQPTSSAALYLAPPGGDVVPLDLNDQAFDRYIGLQFLADAWVALDAARLTDAALLLAEGERVLLRPHRAITAAEALQLAARTAFEQGDAVTITRLEKVAALRKDAELKAMIAASKKLGGASRSSAPGVDLNTTTPAAFALLYACHADVKRAKLAGDVLVLMALSKAIPDMPLLTAEQKEQLLSVTNAPVTEADKPNKQLPQTLRRLAGVGRCNIGDPGCGGFAANDRLSGASRCDPADPTCSGGFAANDRLSGASRCDPNDPTCGGYYLPTEVALAETAQNPQQPPEVRAAALSAREKLAGAMRCQDLNNPGCTP